VWRARHDDGTAVAIKVLGRSGSVLAAEHRRLFRREAQAAARLNHPAAIVQLFDFGEATADVRIPEVLPGSPWMAMELVEDGHRGLEEIESWPQLRTALLRVLEGLAHAHSHGILHRDIKPENILGRDVDSLQLADFGVWAVPEPTSEEFGSRVPIAGTPWAMAPEQFLASARQLGPWTDIYGLACTAWKLATGAPPIVALSFLQYASEQAHVQPPAFLPRFAVPAEFEDWLRRCLKKRMMSRYRDAVGAMSVLEAISSVTEVRPDTVLETAASPWDDTVSLSELKTTPFVDRPAMDVPAVRWRSGLSPSAPCSSACISFTHVSRRHTVDRVRTPRLYSVGVHSRASPLTHPRHGTVRSDDAPERL